MIKNTQLTDLGAVSADFPYGFPKNESSAGANDGTLLNSDYLNDMFQLFQRAVALSGITPNELLDNATNGYQLFDACFGTEKVNITEFFNGTTSSDNGTQKRLKCWKENGGRTVRIEGWISIPTALYNDKIFVLPIGFTLPNAFSLYAVGYSANQLDSRISFNPSTQEFILLGDNTSIAYINWSIPLV